MCDSHVKMHLLVGGPTVFLACQNRKLLSSSRGSCTESLCEIDLGMFKVCIVFFSTPSRIQVTVKFHKGFGQCHIHGFTFAQSALE